MKNIYETERLLLKAPDQNLAAYILEYYKRNKEFLEEWEPVRQPEFYTIEYQENQLGNQLAQIQSGDALRFWLFEKENPEKAIGFFAFSNIVRGVFWSCFLGYGLDGQRINQGYMTEALQKGIEIIFGECGLHRIEANIMPKNARSLRVTEKLGFVNEGISRRYLKINGNWEDHIHMVLLNDSV